MKKFGSNLFKIMGLIFSLSIDFIRINLYTLKLIVFSQIF